MDSYILITGALGGLGSELARECARRGFNLFLTDRPAEADQFCAELSSTFGVQVRYRSCELTEPDSRTALIDGLRAEGCLFHGLINVAGRDFEGAFLAQSREQVLYLVHLLIEGMVDLTHEILTLRDPSRRFMLINISSLAGFYPMPYKAIYSAAKGFIQQFSLALREEIKGFGNVMVVSPAGLPTHAESRRKIEAQGFFGKLTALNTRQVARRTVDLALRDKATYVPGPVNGILAALAGLIPDRFITWFVGKRWQSVQKVVFDKNDPLRQRF